MTRRRLSRSEVAALPIRSSAELLLATQLEQAGIPFEREFRFDSSRRFRADFCVGPSVLGDPFWNVLIEVDGGAWINGRHTRGSGFEKDAEKASLAAINGYRVIRCTPSQVNDGTCLAWVRAAVVTTASSSMDGPVTIASSEDVA